MEQTNVERVIKEMISTCESRIAELNLGLHSTTTFFTQDKEESFSFSLDLSTGRDIGRRELLDAIDQLAKCRDKDLLSALRDEFCRQLRTHELQRLTLTPALLTPTISPQTSPTPTTEHYYFRSQDHLRYCHFEGQRIARELILGGNTGTQAKLLLTGRDDQQMCQWNLEEAKIAEELGDEISEKEFNTIWFQYGGFPYVRPVRKFRRFLSCVVKRPQS